MPTHLDCHLLLRPHILDEIIDSRRPRSYTSALFSLPHRIAAIRSILEYHAKVLTRIIVLLEILVDTPNKVDQQIPRILADRLALVLLELKPMLEVLLREFWFQSGRLGR